MEYLSVLITGVVIVWSSGPPMSCLFSHMSHKWVNVMILIIFF